MVGFKFDDDHRLAAGRRIQVRIPSNVSSKKELLAALDAGLGLPEFFGFNWDALEECLRDLSWLKPVDVVIVHEGLPLAANEDDLRTYLLILNNAIHYWLKQGQGRHDLTVVLPKDCEVRVRRLLTE